MPYEERSADTFLDALQLHVAASRPMLSGSALDTVYIGGGTPSILSEAQLTRLMTMLLGCFRLSEHAEITVEANPNSLSPRKVSLLREHGVNRLSLGVQSFSDPVLALLGRLHDAKQARDAFSFARSNGFGNIGLDLIYGVPGQSMTQWDETLDSAIALRPEHLSIYSLSLDTGSRFFHDAEACGFSLPEDELVVAMYERAAAKLSSAGYDRYEISNFSLPGYACRHNLNYWDRGEYLGLGPAAWSFINGKRSRALADVRWYCERISRGLSAVDFEETIGTESAARESLMLGLRTMNGIDLARFETSFGPEFARRVRKNAAALEQEGLCWVREGRLRLSDRGILLSNEALARLCF